jgi:hypothetical protein
MTQKQEEEHPVIAVACVQVLATVYNQLVI